ncbi:MAG TPA: hypothetical protein VKS60_23715 [Stellaceae bacterium]|nr:hypothetical protein [Stellaceae bacterium]
MSSSALESMLARLYTDEAFLKAFLEDPGAALHRAGLDETDRASLLAIDRDDLLLAAESYSAKRLSRRPGGAG